MHRPTCIFWASLTPLSHQLDDPALSPVDSFFLTIGRGVPGDLPLRLRAMQTLLTFEERRLVLLGSYPIVTLETQLLNMIGNLVQIG